MKTYITLDYELFFGKSGSVERSMIDPTERLVSILDKYNAKAVFFVDVGYLIRMKELMDSEPKLKEDERKVREQIQDLVKSGHDIQLHIHSHWEDAVFKEGNWIFPMEHYRLHSYSEAACHSIIMRYKSYLQDLCGKEVFAFRAGGWCIQPFGKIKKGLMDARIRIDSTVFKGGRNVQGNHYYDFKNIPELEEWSFMDDPCLEDSNGYFKEIPISSYKVSPLFFWKMFFYKKIGGTYHKQFGDGYAVKNGFLQKLRLLFNFTNTVVSIDGYKVSYLQKAFNKYYEKSPNGNFVIIGHPKAFTAYSLQKFDNFLKLNKEKLSFRTFISNNEQN